MKSIFRTITLLAFLLTPAFASAGIFVSADICVSVGNTNSCGTIVGVLANIINVINTVLVPTIFALSFIVFLYGIARAYIFSGGDPEKIKEGHKLLLWGIIGFVVMISLWGIVNVVANTFGLSGDSLINQPSSIPS